MGIINLTPDSFFGCQSSRQPPWLDAAASPKRMLCDGATFLDLGLTHRARSYDDISVREENEDGLLPVVEAIVAGSLMRFAHGDTFRRFEFAEAAVKARGAYN